MQRIGFGKRLLAVIIDGIIVMVLMMFLGFAGLGAGFAGLAGGEAALAEVGLVGMLITALVPLAYSTLEVLKAATPGKMLMKIVIRNADGSAASREVLLKRWGIKSSSSLLNVLAVLTGVSLLGTLSSIAGLVIFLGCFLVLMDQKQALHDKVANTAVYPTA